MIRPTPPGPPGLTYRLFLAGYAGLVALGEPLVWRYLRRRTDGDPSYGDHIEERRGRGAPFAADLWVHAVSLGEMKSAVPLVRLALDAGLKVVTTHATPSGRKAANDAFGPEIAEARLAVRYAPVDRMRYWSSFFSATRPRAGLVMEMEFWPAMIEAAARSGVTLCLSNSQVPSRSFPRALRLARTFGHPASRAAVVFAKSDLMADRFRQLGARNVLVMGETRFDMPLPRAQLDAARALRAAIGDRPVITLASVVAGEEETYLSAIRGLFADGLRPFVIWVPRAPELFDPTFSRLRAAGFRTAARSEALDARLALRSDLADIDILVGNSTGEMFFYLEPADAVVVGGGFVEKGAHNVIEPLALGKPVVTGPSIWTIEFPGVEARAAGVLTVCGSPDALPGTLVGAIGQDAGRKAAEFHAANAGASARIFDAIRPLLTGERS